MTRPGQKGAALLELAIVLPLLLLIFMAVAELGLALLLHQTLVRNVEVSARYMARTSGGLNADCSSNAPWTSASTTATNLIVYGNEAGSGNALISGLDAGDVDIAVVTRTASGVSASCVVQVEVQVNNPGIFGPNIPFLGQAQPLLQARSEERYVGT